MKQIRILVAGMPRMLVDIIEDIVASEPDLTIVGEIDRSTELASAARRTRADVVISRQADSDMEADEMALLLIGRPPKVVAITDDGRQGFVYELRPHRSPLGEMSVERLIAAIRVAARDEHS
ncbi:MAG: hypothetical protein WA418_13045 [Bradyrhizobium sp.]